MKYMRNAIRAVPFHDCVSHDQLALHNTILLVKGELTKASRDGLRARAVFLEMLVKDLAEFEGEVFGE